VFAYPRGYVFTRLMTTDLANLFAVDILQCLRLCFNANIFIIQRRLFTSANFQLLQKEMGDETPHKRRRRAYSVFEDVDDISTTAWTPPR
jgi:hypothetical protein